MTHIRLENLTRKYAGGLMVFAFTMLLLTLILLAVNSLLGKRVGALFRI
jgi:hypothetical protein